MAVEIVIVSSILVSVITALGGILLKLKMKNCKCGSLQCECATTTPPQTPQPENIEPPLKYKLSKKIAGLFKPNVQNATSI